LERKAGGKETKRDELAATIWLLVVSCWLLEVGGEILLVVWAKKRGTTFVLPLSCSQFMEMGVEN